MKLFSAGILNKSTGLQGIQIDNNVGLITGKINQQAGHVLVNGKGVKLENNSDQTRDEQASMDCGIEINENDPLGFLREDRNLYADTTTFEELQLASWVGSQTRTVGISHPTSIQQQCIPAILDGFDVLGIAKTGSGKTAAFLLPIVHVLSQDSFGIFALILSPSRELALQIYDQAKLFGSPLNMTTALIIGGMDWAKQSFAIAHKPHIVLGTPGRIADHLKSNPEFKLTKVKYAVFDEIDSLLEDSFKSEMAVIIKALNPNRQNLYFSATLTSPDYLKLQRISVAGSLKSINLGVHDAYHKIGSKRGKLTFVETHARSVLKVFKSEDLKYTGAQQINKELTQGYLFIPSITKSNYLLFLLKQFTYSVPELEELESEDNNKISGMNEENVNDFDDVYILNKPSNQYDFKSHSHIYNYKRLKRTRKDNLIIVFCSTIKTADIVADMLRKTKFNVALLHSKMAQVQRMNNLDRFRNLSCKILVTTDLAARGLDIPNVNLIVNFDLPRHTQDYIHRVGRTARNGKLGYAVSFVTQYDIDLFIAIEKKISCTIPEIKNINEDTICLRMNTVRQLMALAEVQFDSSYQTSDKELMRRQRDQIAHSNHEKDKKRRKVTDKSAL